MMEFYLFACYSSKHAIQSISIAWEFGDIVETLSMASFQSTSFSGNTNYGREDMRMKVCCSCQTVDSPCISRDLT